MPNVNNQIIVVVAQYALFVVAAAAVVVWLMALRRDKVSLAIEVVVAMALVAVMIKVAGAIHSDPRPFVQNAALKPLFLHPADNGFPSDHTALAAVIAAVVSQYRRWIGWALALLAILIGAARVAANVHHTQDIVAGLIIGYLAAVVALVLRRQVVRPRLSGNLRELTR